ncbi:MAG: hypothetical protein WBD28_02670 [Candidatus Zixiibacteriota bacterium]
MSQEQEKKNEEFKFYENYPLPIVLIRWLFLGAAFVLGIYILFQFKDILAYIYIFYGALCLMLILPLSRCVYCYYHGRVCDCGFGKVASYLFPKNDEAQYSSRYVYFALTYPIWLFPAFLGFIQILRQRSLKALIVFLAFLLVLFLERVFLKIAGCRNCHQRKTCPGVPF